MQDTVNAFVSMFTLSGSDSGPAAGLTFGSKDLYDVAGHVTGCGNPDWAKTHAAAQSHAPPVAALLAGGATLVGKTHTDELAYSLMGVNAHYGTPVNTAAPDRVPGGSSSGSAAAVAAGLVDIGLGSDTGGSVRMPASFCGVWGLRTTHGRVPIYRTMPLAPSFDTAGWFTRDAATMLRASAAFGMEPGAMPTRLLLPVDIWSRASASTIDAVQPLLAQRQKMITECHLMRMTDDDLVDWREAFRMHQGREVWQVHGDWVTSAKPDFGPGIAERFAMAKGITEDEFSWAAAVRQRIKSRMQDVLPAGTVMVFPTSPGPAPLRDASQSDLDTYRAHALEMLCPAGHAGLPQISIPAGTADGGPVGLSVLGPVDGEEAILALVSAL